MNKKISLLATLALPVISMCGTLAKDMLLYLPCDTVKSTIPGVKIAPSIRTFPGKFGKCFCIERRTVNYADSESITLGDNSILKGKNNTLSLPENGFAAISLANLKPKQPNTLSFFYKGSGKIKIMLEYGEESKLIGELTALENSEQYAEFEIVVPNDTATIKITSVQKAVLDKIMFDKGINIANTYHPAGKMRNVDSITIPVKYLPVNSGSISCWVNLKWLKKANSNGNLLFAVTGMTGKKFIARQFSVWDGVLYNVYRLSDKKNCSVSLAIKEFHKAFNNNWNHVVFNWGEKNGQFFNEIIINGTARFKKSIPGKPVWKATEFSLGSFNGSYLNGKVDDFAIFKRPLENVEIEKIYHSNQPISEVIK